MDRKINNKFFRGKIKNIRGYTAGMFWGAGDYWYRRRRMETWKEIGRWKRKGNLRNIGNKNWFWWNWTWKINIEFKTF